MRAFDRDLIRGAHYGQRSCEPHTKAEHMAAPTNAALVKKALANSEPSTHGPCGSRSAARARMFLSTPDQGKRPVATETALECKLDPQHGVRLQEPGIAQRPGVDNFKAER